MTTRRQTASQQRLPTTYVIGAPKAGTTSVAHWLADHEAVFFSTPKEPFYWASDYPNLAAHYGFGTLPEYAALFASDEAHAADLLAEGSTVYLYSRTAVSNILQAVPTARFVVCLRNPPDLLASYHRTQVVTLNEHETDFAKAWQLRATGSTQASNPIDPKLIDYPFVGRLGAAVERLLATVPRDQVHFIVFDDLVSNPSTEWLNLTEFLELPACPRSDFTAQNVSDTMYRSRLLRGALHRPPAAVEVPIQRLRQWSRTTDSPVVRRLKQATWRPAPRPELSEDLRRELTAYFSADVHRLGHLIGRNLQQQWRQTQPMAPGTSG